jgi:hypothetical protein
MSKNLREIKKATKKRFTAEQKIQMSWKDSEMRYQWPNYAGVKVYLP